jgi:hypothetical protein
MHYLIIQDQSSHRKISEKEVQKGKTGLVEINKNSEHMELPALYGQIVDCALLPCVQFDYAQYQH